VRPRHAFVDEQKYETPTPAKGDDMNHALKACVLVIGAGLGLGERALAQPCFVCSDDTQNTAVGTFALGSPTEYENNLGSGNTATGYAALASNTSHTAPNGSYNTANGSWALHANTTGYNNTALGYNALLKNTTGLGNASQGVFALQNNTSGDRNSALGNQALLGNTTGSYNLGLGFAAGLNITTGSNNIDIGGPAGSASESNTIRIGLTSASGAQPAHSATYVAGIYNTSLQSGSLPVYVDSAGQLSVGTSSERFKTGIVPMSVGTKKLQQLRPVSFFLKSDPKGAVQYGLIAEEVDKIYPELVVRDDTGKIQGIRYDELAPILLNEVQLQLTEVATLKQQVEQQQQKLTEVEQLKQQVAELKQANESMLAAMAKLLAKDERVAMR
jgi:Chaperone of endosialidase